jgi:endo-1,4-beta-xylanase
VHGWDVVNEAIDDGDAYLRESPWTRLVGEDFVAKAFEYAREADPNVELYYNDYNIELPEKRDKTLRLLRQLQSQGLRIDAVGIQGHWLASGLPLQEIEDAILAFHGLGLQVMITELDVDVLPRKTTGANVADQESESTRSAADALVCPTEVLQQQAEQYAALFRILRRHQDKISRVTFWGLHDGRSWLNHWPVRGRTNHPLLFDRQCRPKPALDAVLQAFLG